METYKNYIIEKNEVNYYEAIDTKDCDALVLWAKTKEQLKIEIDEHLLTTKK